MAVQPLSPATDRRLGGPLPHQPANQTRGHLSAINLWHKGHATSMRHAVLAVVSNCCPPLKGRFLTRYSPVRHFPLLPLAETSFHRFSFDLHVLSTPPAFVLSQDQTLVFNPLTCYWVLRLTSLSLRQTTQPQVKLISELTVVSLSTCIVFKIPAPPPNPLARPRFSSA